MKSICLVLAFLMYLKRVILSALIQTYIHVKILKRLAINLLIESEHTHIIYFASSVDALCMEALQSSAIFMDRLPNSLRQDILVFLCFFRMLLKTIDHVCIRSWFCAVSLGRHFAVSWCKFVIKILIQRSKKERTHQRTFFSYWGLWRNLFHCESHRPLFKSVWNKFFFKLDRSIHFKPDIRSLDDLQKNWHFSDGIWTFPQSFPRTFLNNFPRIFLPGHPLRTILSDIPSPRNASCKY